MKFTHAVALGLGAAVLVMGGASSAPAHGKAGQPSFGPNCRPLTLVAASPVKGYAEPSVCVVADRAGKRFYQFSGVLRFVAGRAVQARFGVGSEQPLDGTTLVSVVGYQGTDPSRTYYGYGVVEPGGEIKIEGTRPGWLYTVSITGQIPAAIPAA